MGQGNSNSGSQSEEAIRRLRESLESGMDWPRALLQAMSLWTATDEIFRDTRIVYLIGSEAFDWLALANRLSAEARDLIPADELEELIFTGKFPDSFDEAEFKEILGMEKYSAYLNFFYGVEVEFALQRTVEAEVGKRFYASGRQYAADYTDVAYQAIYRKPYTELVADFREDAGRAQHPVTTMTELKEFTYWLFKRRLRVSDKAKIASDTSKGIDALDSPARVDERMGATA